MADITSLDLLNQTQIELLQKYDGALSRFNEINNYFEDGKAIEAINAENALKLGGLQMSQIKGIGFKNRVINGDFSVWQRGESFTFRENENGYTADRFLFFHVSDGTYTVSKSTLNNKNAYRITCETPPTNLNESQNIHGIHYLFEGQHLYDLIIDKKNITISFWFNSNIAGEYTVGMRNTSYKGNTGEWDSTKVDSYVTTFEYTTPNTPQKITVTIPLDTTWTYEPTNNKMRGFDISIGYINQGDFTTSTINTWLNGEYKLTTPTAVNWAAEAGNFIEIAELQVEEGDTATAFEYIPFDIQLLRCMRYYEKSYPYNVKAGTSGSIGGESSFAHSEFINNNLDRCFIKHIFRVEKRSTPIIKIYSYSGNLGKVSPITSGGELDGTWSATDSGRNGFNIYSLDTTATTGQKFWFGWEADAELY